jgi:phage recombination protein Bet
MENSMLLYAPSEQDQALVRNTIAKDLDQKEFNLFMAVCKAHGLNPILRQIHPVKYKGRMVFQVGIDGFRLQAQRSNEYRGQLGPFWCGADGIWKDVWTDNDPPAAAKVGVYRESLKDPNTGEYLVVWGIAKFSSFAKWFYDKDTKKKHLGEIWAAAPDNQLAKCAEAQAIRKAFPAETSALFTKDETASQESMERLADQDAAAAAPTGKPDVTMPEKNVTPETPKDRDAQSVSQIKEMLDEMKSTRETRDKYNDMVKKGQFQAALNAVEQEFSLFLDQKAADAS